MFITKFHENLSAVREFLVGSHIWTCSRHSPIFCHNIRQMILHWMMFFPLKLVTLTHAGALEHQLITVTRH